MNELLDLQPNDWNLIVLPRAYRHNLLVTMAHFATHSPLIVLDCGTLGNNIRTLMPLTITPDQLARGLAILEDGLKHISA